MALEMHPVRWRPLLLLFLLLPLAVAGLAHGLLAFNADLVSIATGDPDAPDTLANVRADGLNIYTSGFACGQLLSFLFGAGLIVLDRRPVQLVRVKLLAALGAGTVLALSDLAVVLAAAPARASTLWHRYDPGLPSGGDLLHDPTVRCALLLGLVGFPLWAVLGAGTGALLVARPALTGPMLAIAIVTTDVLDGAAQLHSTVWAALAVALLPPQVLPPSTLLGLVAAAGQPQPYRIPVAVAATAGAVLYTTLLCFAGRAALRAQLRRRPALRSPGQRRGFDRCDP